MKEKIIKKFLSEKTIKVLLVLLLSTSLLLLITSTIFVYKLNTGKFPTRTEVHSEHGTIQDSVNSANVMLRKLTKP